MTTPTGASAAPRHVLISKWIWLVGMAVALVGVILSLALYPSLLTVLTLVITIVQAAVAVPAALMVPRRKRWARMTLMVLAVLSIGSLYSAFQTRAWASLVLNIALASTLGLLQDVSVREFFGLPREPWLRRVLRPSSR